MDTYRHLNYMRSLSPSKAVFFYKTELSDFVPLSLEDNRIRAPKAGYTDAFKNNGDIKNISALDLAYSNPQHIQSCYVPPNIKYLHCRFSLRVEANSLEPYQCEDSDVRQNLANFSFQYKEKGGYKELATRYCKNILSGNWLWRNQRTLGTKITVITSNNNEYVIDDARRVSWEDIGSEKEDKILNALAEEMETALTDPKVYWFAEVQAIMETAFCQEIHPSQKLIDPIEGEASKQYATTRCPDGSKAVCFHAEKVGAALQMIDDWWDDNAYQPLRVHEYGVDRGYVVARRHPDNENDFYTLLKSVPDYIDTLENVNNPEAINNNIHYLMAVLCKGGFFSRGKS